MNGVVAVADEITPIRLWRPRAVGMTGIAFAVLIGLAPLFRAGPADPRTRAWLVQASSRWEVQARRGLLPFCGIFLPWLRGEVHA